MYMNLSLFDGKFNADRPCERLFHLIFMDGVCGLCREMCGVSACRCLKSAV